MEKTNLIPNPAMHSTWEGASHQWPLEEVSSPPVANSLDASPNQHPYHNAYPAPGNAWDSYNWSAGNVNVGTSPNVSAGYENSDQWYNPNQFVQQQQWEPQQTQYQDWNQQDQSPPQGQPPAQGPAQVQQWNPNEAQNEYQTTTYNPDWQQYQDWPPYNQAGPQGQSSLEQNQGQVSPNVGEIHSAYEGQEGFVSSLDQQGELQQNTFSADPYQQNFPSVKETASIASSADFSEGHSLSNSNASQANLEFDHYNANADSEQDVEQSNPQSDYYLQQSLTLSEHSGPPATNVAWTHQNSETSEMAPQAGDSVSSVLPNIAESQREPLDNSNPSSSDSSVQMFQGDKNDHNRYLLGSGQPVPENSFQNYSTVQPTSVDAGAIVEDLSVQLNSVSLEEKCSQQADETADTVVQEVQACDSNKQNPIGLSAYENSNTYPQPHTFHPPAGGIEVQSTHSNPGSQTSDDWEMVPPQIQIPQEQHIDQTSDQRNVQFIVGSSNEGSPISGSRTDHSIPSTPGTVSPSSHNILLSSEQESHPHRNLLLGQAGNTLPSVQENHAGTIAHRNLLLGQTGNIWPPVQEEQPNPSEKEVPATPQRQVPLSGDMNPVSSQLSDKKSADSDINTHNISNILVSNLSSPQQSRNRNDPLVSDVSSEFDSRGSVENIPSKKLDGSSSKAAHSSIRSKSSYHQETSVSKINSNKIQNPILPRKGSPFQPPVTRSGVATETDSIRDSKMDSIRDSKIKSSDEKTKQSIAAGRMDTPSRRTYNSSRGQDTRARYRTGKDSSSENKVLSKPPLGGSKLPHMSPKRLQSSLHDNRAKQNMSPATTLWANPELSVPNILLAPVASLPTVSVGTPILATPTSTAPSELTPVVSLISRLDQQIKESSPEPTSSGHAPKHFPPTEPGPSKNDQKNFNGIQDPNYRSRSTSPEKAPPDRRDRQYGSRSQNHSREGSLEREYLDDYRDKPRDAYRDERTYYNRSTTQSGYYDDPRYSRDQYRDPYYERANETDRRYGQPSTSHSTEDLSQTRPESEQERPPTEYDRDYYYRDHDRYRGYEYDYYQRPYYYDSRYAQYDYPPESRYSQGYFDEMGYYHRPHYRDRVPQTAGQHTAGYDYSDGRSHSHSGAHTPGSISDSGDNEQLYQYDQNGQYRRYGSRPSSRHGYEDSKYYSREDYDYYYNRGYAYDPQTEVEPTESRMRMTPAKFSYPHVCARFGSSGQLIKVQPNCPTEGQPAIVEIHEVEDMLGDLEEVEELRSFPGPLVKEDTYKNDVLMFCQKKAHMCSENMGLSDRDSCELIWRLLELLIKQNGAVVGSDIADLLLDGHEPTTREYRMSGMKISQSLDNLDVDDESVSEAGSTSEVCDRALVNRGRGQEEAVDRFRHLLLYGRKKEALEWAMKNNLWGHALFLASKMDNRAHATIMMKFANNAMRLNDPLQTLYQLMSGRQPAAVTCIADVKWGDWRPHLAMVLSNHSSKPDMVLKSISLMADTLAAKGYLHASHFCYLMAQVSFGSFTKKTSKIVLIGSSHTLPLEEFATNEAIQCTEIYEYAMSLGNPGFVLGNLQCFKFLYACRLAEFGHLQEALHYCEVIGGYIQKTPACYQPTLVRQVYELGNRLKYFDAQRMQSSEDAEDPVWLINLQKIVQGHEDGSIQPMSGSVTPMEYGTTNSSECGEVDGQMLQSYCQNASYHQSLNQSQSTDDQYQQDPAQYLTHSQYTPDQSGPSQYHDGPAQQYQTEASFTQPAQYETTPQQAQYHTDPSHFTQYQNDSSENNAFQGLQPGQSSQSMQQYQPHPPQLSQYQTDPAQFGQTLPDQSQYHQDAAQSQNTSMYGQSMSNNEEAGPQSPAGTTEGHPPVHRQTSRSSTISEHSHTSRGEGNDNFQSNFDYFGAATHQQRIVAPRLRKRTTSESSVESKSGAGRPQPSNMASNPIPEKKEMNNKSKKQSKGWFGGIFSWTKSKNEMKLPDDKNPAIVWDDAEKRWKNTDGDDELETTKLPPPKDHELTEPSVPQMPHSMNTDTAPPSGNRFSKPKGRGVRSQYVDVLNPKPTSSATVPSSLFNVLPTSASSPAIYNPGGHRTSKKSEDQHQRASFDQSNSASTEPVGGHPPIQTDIAAKHPPIQTDIAAKHLSAKTSTEDNLSSSSSMSSLSYEVQQLTIKTPQQTDAPPAVPTMFNPAEFPSSQPYSQSSAGPKRYGNRRVYPK
ncbi:hypothetical protein ScPMuIL_011449 [Solemya velum]